MSSVTSERVEVRIAVTGAEHRDMRQRRGLVDVGTRIGVPLRGVEILRRENRVVHTHFAHRGRSEVADEEHVAGRRRSGIGDHDEQAERHVAGIPDRQEARRRSSSRTHRIPANRAGYQYPRR